MHQIGGMTKIYNILLMVGQGIFIAYDITYFREASLTLALITLASSGFDVASSIMEIPTSMFFDKVSPRVTLAIGNVMRLCGFVLFALNPANFAVVLIGQVLTGIGSATESGAASALYVNERKEVESSFEKIMGEIAEFGSVAMLAGGLLGAIAYNINARLIWILPAVIYLAATILLIRMPLNSDMEEETAVSAASFVRDFIAVGRKTVTNVNWWMLLMVDTASLSMYLLWQVRLSGSDTTEVWNQFGGLIVMNIAGYIAGKLSQKISLGRTWRVLTVLLVNIVLCVALAWTSGFWLGMVLYLPHVVLLGWLQNVYAGSVHASIDDNERATTFSLQSAPIALAAVVVGPMCGWLTDHFGLGVGMSSTLTFFIVPIAVECYRGVQRRAQSAR